jgi:hypothetical protein
MAITIFEPVEVRPFERIEGVQKIYRFRNATGASVIKGTHTYGGEDGLWEIAPIYFVGHSNYEFELFYPEEVCPDGDVIGWCDDLDVEEKLRTLNNLLPAQVEKAIGNPPFAIVCSEEKEYFDRSSVHQSQSYTTPQEDIHRDLEV